MSQSESAAGPPAFSSSSSLPYVLPFVLFLVFLAVGDVFRLGEWEYPFRTFVLAAVGCFVLLSYFVAMATAG